ncbi:cell division protein FtsQ/DivIB [Tichowtungia aerotolerans]|uniref:FtsQ-type POTRA domain-containing protein n=1 Tax=Tichowtungia aerotolerans TaxID=2697043 RepID=A0A6P1M7S5_9BACT|nr:FtsQ-type POTRA domain-containing protein [Tichowtungia aerotolerans]QHI70092.1 FtsQ-type POTRA domain-containing protein [Tichowtungia aerotolerans]
MAAAKPRKRKQYARTKSTKKDASARRGVLVFIGLALSAVLLFAVYQLLAYSLSFFFSRNDAFELKNIVVTSDGRLSSSQLKEYANLTPGINLFDVKFDDLREDLTSVPLVESVHIQRRLPDTLLVRVSERVALAQVHWKWRAVPFLVDRHGVVMPATRTGRALPMIEGLKVENLRPGERITNEGVLFALKLLSTCTEMRLSTRIRFERFDLRYPDYITATLADGISVRFPRHSAREKMIRLARVMELALEQGRRLKTIDLTPDGLNVPTT